SSCYLLSLLIIVPPLISPLSLHDALPIFAGGLGPAGGLALRLDRIVGAARQPRQGRRLPPFSGQLRRRTAGARAHRQRRQHPPRSEEHTSELQSRENLVCRLLLEKKKLCM